MRTPLTALTIFLLAFAAVAGEPRIPLVQPKPSTLTVASVAATNQHHAEFSGQIWVTGTLYVEWLGGKKPTAEYRLIPDAKSRKQLPHFSRYGVTWVGINNGPAALQMAVSPSAFQHVMDRQLKVFKVTGAWQLDGYAVGIECDAPYAYANVAAVDIPDQKVVASIDRPETC